MILCVPYEDIQRGLSEDQLRVLKKTGVIIIRGGVPKEVTHGPHSLSSHRLPTR